MKQFFKMMLAALCGCILASLITFFFMITIVGGLVSLASDVEKPGSGILRIDFSKFAVVESPKSTDLQSFLQGSALPTETLIDITNALKHAATDPNIDFLFLKTDGLAAGIAQVEELRQAISKFRISGKAVIAFNEFPSLGSYYLASAADKVYLSSNTGAGPQISGVTTQMIFVGDLLKKLGINAQLIRHGKYKSAGEMFIKGAPSKENLEQTEEMINSIWNTIAEGIEESRFVSKKKFMACVNELKLNTCQDMVDNGLADALFSREDLKHRLTTLDQKDSFDQVTFVDLPDYIAAHKKIVPEFARNQIAVLVAEGEIVEGIDDLNIAGDRFATNIARLRENDNVKAVVLRVSSPGGSVLASDKILSEIKLLKEVKPVIASYGDYAASGGYWISSSCDYIFSDRTTLTGSIGVFAMIPDVSKALRDKLSVNIVTVSSAPHAANLFAPLDAESKASLQIQIDDIYDKFVENVSSGRDLTPSYVDGIAQGRVWTGDDALGLKLVDEIGTLDDAIQYAAIAAGDADLSHWRVRTYGDMELSVLDQLIQSINLTPDESDILASTPLAPLGIALKTWKASSKERFFARMPYQMVLSD